RAPGTPSVPGPFMARGERGERGRGGRGEPADTVRGGRPTGTGGPADTLRLPPAPPPARGPGPPGGDSLRAALADPGGHLRDLSKPDKPKHLWFQRPISLDDQPYIDQTYRYGSTMGGYFQQHQGVEFNNGNGTPVHAIGGGTVVWAGPAEAGALTVAIRH